MPSKRNHTPATREHSSPPIFFAGGGTATCLTAQAVVGSEDRLASLVDALAEPPVFYGLDPLGTATFEPYAPVTGDGQ